MSDLTLYLHIGAAKTGTTALQRFLAQNSGRLMREFGVLYPNLNDIMVHGPMREGGIFWQGRYFERTDGSDDLELFGKYIRYCKRKSLKALVISHEALLVNWHERIGRLAGKLDADIKIICYVRRQDYYLESAWKQWGHKFVASSELVDSLTSHATKWGGWRLTDWHELLEPWARNFGAENIIVRPYEKRQMVDGVLPDFLRTINVTWPEKPVLSNDVDANLGLSRDALEFLSLLSRNEEFQKTKLHEGLYGMVYDILDNSYRKDPFESYEILSPRERIEILNEYESSNRMVAKTYLKREDGRLFYEPWPSPDAHWQRYEGLDLDRATPIIANLMLKLHEKYKELSICAKIYRRFSAWMEFLSLKLGALKRH